MNVDLRSDTVTKPTPAMLEAMMAAKVGDDVFEEDETVLQLEKKAAAMFGKEAGLFCSSGTMANQISIKCHVQPADEVICDISAHVYNYEGGGIAFHSGASVRLIYGDRGVFSAQDVVKAIQPDNIHYPVSKLVCIENTCNRGGGRCWELQEMQQIKDVCDKHRLKLHLDGARIFNAIIYKGYSAKEVGSLFDTISICLSKGLGAPVGSVILGDKETIKTAKRFRKLFGGGMRQAGYLAAAGIYALDNHIERLKEDHIRAKRLEESLNKMSYVADVFPVETNIVVFRLKPEIEVNDFLQKLAEKNIKAVGFGSQAVRFATHLDVNDSMIDYVTEVLKKIA
ncbi:MAG: threonine aldolase family protein [Bacteroidia bacterium]